MKLLMVGSIALCALVGTLVGVKLLGIAARSRKFPELAVGAGLFAYAAVSQPALLLQQALGEEGSLALRMGVIGIRVFAFYITLLSLSLFTWRVFGAESRWRLALAAGLAVAALISGGMSLRASWLLQSAGVPVSPYGRLGMIPLYVVTFGWVSLESLRYYLLMRKRRALGLADPIVTNRFFVWGAGEGVATLVVLALLVAMMTRPGILTADPFVSWFVTLAGLVNALVWWLAFTPPKVYLRWVSGSTAEAVADR